MDVNDATQVEHGEEARKGVIVAYQEIMNKLKSINRNHEQHEHAVPEESFKPEDDVQAVKSQSKKANEEKDDDTTDSNIVPDNLIKFENEDNAVRENVIELASRETADGLAKNLAEFRLFVGKSLDDIRIKLTAEYDKFYTLRQAIDFSKKELDQLYKIKVTVNTLSLLLMAQKEKEAAFEKELTERRQIFEIEKSQMEKERFHEQNEYLQKRDAMRKLENEQYEMEKKGLYHELLDKRRELEEAFEAREAALAAREAEHQQLKDREARILAREQEFVELKEKEARNPEELKTAIAKAESNMHEQLTRKYEYDMKLMQIERESERKLDQQKIYALEQQIEQYKALKQLFS